MGGALEVKQSIFHALMYRTSITYSSVHRYFPLIYTPLPDKLSTEDRCHCLTALQNTTLARCMIFPGDIGTFSPTPNDDHTSAGCRMGHGEKFTWSQSIYRRSLLMQMRGKGRLVDSLINGIFCRGQNVKFMERGRPVNSQEVYLMQKCFPARTTALLITLQFITPLQLVFGKSQASTRGIDTLYRRKRPYAYGFIH